MNLAFLFARRYLFSKKSTHVINIISAISIFGIAVGSAALVVILSVFNGFGDLLGGLFHAFNPDIKITATQGKVFSPTPEQLKTLHALPSVQSLSQTLEENAMFEYNGSQDFGIIKGVDSEFSTVTRIDTTVTDGEYALQRGEQALAVVGRGMQYKLSLQINDRFNTLKVYMPKRTQSASAFGVAAGNSPLRILPLEPTAIFAIQYDFDGQYILSSLEFARELLGYTDEVSALEVKIKPGYGLDKATNEIQTALGTGFRVLDRYHQDEAFFKIMNVEKAMAYIILSFTLLLVAFNMIGSLWMLVMDKRNDIAMLKSMGATDRLVRNIFFSEGMLMCIIGAGIGFVLAITLCVLQQQFGLVRLGQGDDFLVEAYPVSMRWIDFVGVFVTVLCIGLLASWLPAKRAAQIESIVRNE